MCDNEKRKPMRAAEIRKLASDPEKGVPHADVFGEAWRLYPHQTRRAIWGMDLTPAPYGAPKYGEKLYFLKEVADAMLPMNKGKAFLDRFTAEKGGGRFMMTWGYIDAYWPWFPNIYKDENGVPNCFIIMGDGFPQIRLQLGTDEQWRLDYLQTDAATRLHYPDPDDYARCPDSWKKDVALPPRRVPVVMKVLGLPKDTDPVSVMGTVVTEDQILDMVVPDPWRPES